MEAETEVTANKEEFKDDKKEAVAEDTKPDAVMTEDIKD